MPPKGSSSQQVVAPPQPPRNKHKMESVDSHHSQENKEVHDPQEMIDHSIPPQAASPPIVNALLDSTLTQTLTEAIMLMTAELQQHDEAPTNHKIKAKEPDTFNGSDPPKKLNNFILLCNLYFHGNSAYENDTNKVTLTLLSLQGSALEFFKPSLLDSNDYPMWIDNWSAFICTLKT